MKSILNMSFKKALTLIFISLAIIYIGLASAKIYRWQLHQWLGTYWLSSESNNTKNNTKHYIFTMVDHYEPGFDSSTAILASKNWLNKFEPIANRHFDSYGNNFKYSWFYPYDQANDDVIKRLIKTTQKGFGEIEFHWHHPKYTNNTFREALSEAIGWFNKHGLMISDKPNAKPNFAFIHGNWALDNSLSVCGVDNEIDILQEFGGYMDMTFSTIGQDSQPFHKINQLYHVVDTPDSKSYESGQEAIFNKVNDDFLIFQGPLNFSLDLSIEYGAVENYALPTPKRIRKWMDSNIHVNGKPEWVFIKVYSHGIQSDAIINSHLDSMLSDLYEEVDARSAKLHFMTAREAYNVVKAVEAGLSGNPEEYRDFVIDKPASLSELPSLTAKVL
jgi:hypothetical protein